MCGLQVVHMHSTELACNNLTPRSTPWQDMQTPPGPPSQPSCNALQLSCKTVSTGSPTCKVPALKLSKQGTPRLTPPRSRHPAPPHGGRSTTEALQRQAMSFPPNSTSSSQRQSVWRLCRLSRHLLPPFMSRSSGSSSTSSGR